jgi:phenylacetate-coenzyme A ligase PaaK-like adenylate-forming protein
MKINLKEILLNYFYHMPYPLKVLAATAKGLHLRWWRYGVETERLIIEALERESWCHEKLKEWQHERLSFVLHRAATRVPYYKALWSQRRLQGDQSSWQYIENWPILEKDFLRENPAAFIAEDCNSKRMYNEHTSGTTGKPLDLWITRENLRGWYALVEARWRNWYGVSRNDRWAILGGQLVTPFNQVKPPFWIWNASLHQLYMSSYHLKPNLIQFYLEALQYYQIKYIYGYTSSLYALALGVLRQKLFTLPIEVVITNAEPIFDYQRQTIEKAFRCPVRETYGMSEYTAAAGECETGQLHIWPEVGFIEIFNENLPIFDSTGDLICTSLLNTDMPLIRYRVGDRGRISSSDQTCSCGRRLPLLVSIDGRSDDILYTYDGRSIGRLDPIFKVDLPILEAQIVQESLDQITVRYIPTSEFTLDTGEIIIKRLMDRMGKISVNLEAVNAIPREANGKFRAVICNLTAEIKNTI